MLAEIQNMLRHGESVPMLTDYSDHRLPTIQATLNKQTHPKVMQLEASLAGGAAVDEDGDLLMTQTDEDVPTVDGFSKALLEPTDCFMK
jgi:hypothetical protein